ncbi:MAG: energy transducer TonB [Saprospiraceae bacterium]
MKNTWNNLIALLFITLAFHYPGSSQGSLTNELKFEVNRVNPPVSITKEKLKKANTLIELNNEANDLDLYFKPSWIRAYISVEVSASCKGKKRKAVSKNDALSQEQKDIMNMADAGTGISVQIQYIPENTLTHNDVKDLNFTFTVDPENEAKYSGGQQKLNQYLMEHAISKIPDGSFKNYDLTAIKFTINEAGEIINAHVFESVYQSYKNEKVNKLLLEAVRSMPCWEPAKFSNGIKVKQDFVLTVGNMESCVINLLNIR